MTDSRQGAHQAEDVFGGAEPARDARLGALLSQVVGASPAGDVDWPALADRIATARARQRMAWWSYAARWERRAVPVAIAAGLAGVIALWGLGTPSLQRPETVVAMTADPVAALVGGTTPADAARSYAGSLSTGDDLAAVEAY